MLSLFALSAKQLSFGSLNALWMVIFERMFSHVSQNPPLSRKTLIVQSSGVTQTRRLQYHAEMLFCLGILLSVSDLVGVPLIVRTALFVDTPRLTEGYPSSRPILGGES